MINCIQSPFEIPKFMMKVLGSQLFFLFLSLSALADRPQHHPQELTKWGYKKFEPPVFFSSSSLTRALTPQDVPLPMELQFPTEQFGAVLHQFQDWSSPPYFHAGLDIRGEKNQEVLAPVSGTIEAGYYSYVDEVDGRSTKYFLPLSDVLAGKGEPPWGKSYFEIAITNANGFRFELHHIDPDLLSESIKTRILQGGFVFAGERVGHLVEWNRFLWGVKFHHLHYNVVSPTGIYLNPLKISNPIEDSLPPEIVAIYSPIFPGPCGSSFPRLDPNNPLEALPNKGYLVVETFDQISGGKERLAPAKLQADFVHHPSFQWDFSYSLESPSGQRPNITKMHLYYLCDQKGYVQLATRSHQFYYIVPLPNGYAGPVTITVSDPSGNSVVKTVTIL